MSWSRTGFALLLTSLTGWGQITISEQANLVASEGAGDDRFGTSVGVDGDTALIGAPGPQGSLSPPPPGGVHVFDRVGGVWTEGVTLFSSDGASGDRFGDSVGLSGDLAIVGAPRDDDGGDSSGSAYVFERTGTTWNEVTKLVSPNAGAGHLFGRSVAISGTTCVVGASADPAANSEGGAAYVFVQNGASWDLQATLLASDNASMDNFGAAVAIRGDDIAVGSSMDEPPNAQRGKTHVFVRSGTTWTEQVALQPFDAVNFAHMGRAVHLDGDLLFAGAPERDVGGQNFLGGVYVWRRSGTVWNPETVLVPSDGASFDFFGGSIGTQGDLVAVGSPQHGGAGLRAGAVYVYQDAGGGTWNELDKLTASDAGVDDRFGASVAFENGEILAGAWGNDDLGQASGSTYVFAVLDLPSFCFGDGGASPGCTPCPCGNDAPAGTPGGCINSSAQSAQLLPSGVPSLEADTLRFELTGGNPSTFGVLVSADNRLPSNPANPCFGQDSGVVSVSLDGLRCVGGGVQRHGARPTDAAGAIGETTNGWGPPDGPPGGLIAQGGFVAGQTRHYQVFYREQDTQVCATGQNTSNGTSVVFVP